MSVFKPILRVSTLLTGVFALNGCEMPYQIKTTLASISTPASLPADGGGEVLGSQSATPSPAPASTPNSDLCITNPMAAACIKTPAVTTPGVVTILFTMSEIPQGSATLILANAIKYATPKANPKILFLKDSATNGEDEGDPEYIKNTLLLGYDLEYGVISSGGLDPAKLAGKDLVMISNPGYPLSDRKTLDTLSAFTGGVILLGDDMAHGSGFSVESFTGLIFKDNGSSISCGGHTYSYDNLGGYNYQVAISSQLLPGIPVQYQNYEYGNDLDITEALPGTEVLAWATAAAGTCDIGRVPAVVRHPR